LLFLVDFFFSPFFFICKDRSPHFIFISDCFFYLRNHEYFVKFICHFEHWVFSVLLIRGLHVLFFFVGYIYILLILQPKLTYVYVYFYYFIHYFCGVYIYFIVKIGIIQCFYSFFLLTLKVLDILCITFVFLSFFSVFCVWLISITFLLSFMEINSLCLFFYFLVICVCSL